MLDAKDLEMFTEIMVKIVEPVRKDITVLQSGMEGMRKDITGLQQKVEELQKTSETVQKDVADIRLTLEQEVIKGIHIIDEGHLDLSRKMNQILETKEERDLIELRVLSLEHEVRRIKDRLEIA